MTYAALLTYLAELGRRHLAVGRAEITFTGEASGNAKYPLFLIEADPLREAPTPGLTAYTLAVQVLDKPERAGAEAPEVLLTRTGGWWDEFEQALRDEAPGLLDGTPQGVAFIGTAGTNLATGWRYELRLNLRRDFDRNANAAKFKPRTQGGGQP